MPKSVALYLLAIVLSLFNQNANAENLNIGVILPLTGPASGNARFGRDGILLAMERPTVAGKLKIYFEDYGSEPSKAVDAYRKLRDINKVHAFLVFGSPAAMAISSLVDHDKNVQFAIASAENLTKKGGYSFRVVSSSAEESKFIVQRFELSGKHKASLVHVDDDFGESYLRGIGVALENDNKESLDVYSFLPKETDFRSMILKLRSRKPEVVVLAAFAQPVGLFLRQAKELNFRSTFVCPLACYNPDLFTLGQGAEEGLVITSPAQANDSALIKEYRTKFNEDPNFISWGFYDSIMMISEIVEECIDKPEVGSCLHKNLLRKEGFSTTRGQLSFNESGEMPFKLMEYVAKGGKFVPLP